VELVFLVPSVQVQMVVLLLFSYLFTAIACSFFAYAEFASMVPVSAYTYSYVAFGEIIAWIIGWALIMEYSVGNITVAISWSDYFTGLLESGGLSLPQWVQMDFLSASRDLMMQP
jgi:amino acid transporter